MSYTGASLKALMPILTTMPEGIHFATKLGGKLGIDFQAGTQEQVARIRAHFPGVVWNKRHEPNPGWWEYDGDWNGLHVHIYACREAPPTCRAIEETVIVKERVPVTFEERDVEKKVVRWDCSQETVTP